MDSSGTPRRARRRPLVNRHALTDTTHASDALGVLGAIVHPVGGAERLLGTVYRGERRLGSFEVIADEDAELPQVNVDVVRFGPGGTPAPGSSGASGGSTREAGDDCGCAGKGDPDTAGGDGATIRVKPDGYIVLHASWGEAGYHVTLSEPGEEGPKTAFDSRRLGEGDLFAVTLIRPGRYAVRTGRGKGGSGKGRGAGAEAAGEIRVAYPTPGRTRRAEAPVRIAVEKGAIDPREVEVEAAQGVVFEIRGAGAAVAVELVEPDDGPDAGKTDPKRPRARARRRSRPSNPKDAQT